MIEKKVNMTEKTASAYDLRTVTVFGVEIEARPVEWNVEDYDGQGHDKYGNPLEPTAFITTCPKCGNLIKFSDTKSEIKCPTCDPGQIKEDKKVVITHETPKETKSTIETKKQPNIKAQPKQEIPKQATPKKETPKPPRSVEPDLPEFIDPIKSGEMKIE